MYELDTAAARKADTTGGSIKELGKYIGEFTQAVDLTTDKNTKGIALYFVSNSGQKAILNIYTKMANGDHIMGFDTLMAIMTCLQLRSIKPVQGQVKYYDFDTKTDATKPGTLFPDLCKKPIGVLLETEDYQKSNNAGVGTRMVLKSVFQATSELTASEILDRKTQPEQLSKMVAALRHRPIRGARPTTASASTGGTPRQASSGFEDMDDDIPFINPLRGAARCLAM